MKIDTDEFGSLCDIFERYQLWIVDKDFDLSTNCFLEIDNFSKGWTRSSVLTRTATSHFFPDNVCCCAPPVTVCHTMKI